MNHSLNTIQTPSVKKHSIKEINKNNKTVIIIPVRYNSSRLPGKPLMDLFGVSMIQRTYEKCIKAMPAEDVFIATDSFLIKKHCQDFNANVLMTDTSCLTGKDRVAEASKKIKCDVVINVQGDEPIINPLDIVQRSKNIQEK